MKIKHIISFLIFLTVLSCAKVPLTGRKQLSLFPESPMLSLSFTSYSEFLSQNPPLPAANESTQLVRKVGGNIAVAVQSFMKSQNLTDRLDGYKWEYNVVNDKTVNAWCMPGGKIVVYSGLLPVTKDETGLAVVMGHEIAHAIARHGNERMSQQMALSVGAIGLDVALANQPQQTKDIFMTSFGVGSTLGMLAYSRQHEYEADKMGLVFMAMAGYNPERAISFWKEMSQMSQGAPPELLSTHPSDENRIKALWGYMKEAKKYYKPQI